MTVSLEDGLRPLAGAQRLAKSFRGRFKARQDVPPEAFAEGEPVVNDTTPALRKTVLRLLGVITTSRGGEVRR
jgi:hypothetical protein